LKINLLLTGKTEGDIILSGVKLYQNRLTRYADFAITEISVLKNTANLSEKEIKRKEAELILKKISDKDFVILLDEKGKEYTSVEFSTFLNKQNKPITFIVGGAYGFDEAIYNRANGMVSLSKMTFTHQMIRLIFVEQLYRAMTILNGEPYHHS
jgi:23S rRNA (pseudouridine1915-N3)-methyltransferase